MPASTAQRAQKPALTKEQELLYQLYKSLLESDIRPENFDFGPAYEGAVIRRRYALQAFRAWNNSLPKKALP